MPFRAASLPSPFGRHNSAARHPVPSALGRIDSAKWALRSSSSSAECAASARMPTSAPRRRGRFSYRSPAASSRPAPVAPSPQSPRANARTYVESEHLHSGGATPATSSPILASPASTERLPAGPAALPVVTVTTPTSSTTDTASCSPNANGWRPPTAANRIDTSASPTCPDLQRSTETLPPPTPTAAHIQPRPMRRPP